MKINKVKLLVGTMAIAAVAATVGSISGTVAWFQYSTRSTAAYSGAAAHVSENLEIRIARAAKDLNGDSDTTDDGEAAYDGPWLKDLRVADVQAYLAHTRATEDYDLRPITSGAALDEENKVATTFYKNPIYQYSGEYAPEAPAVSYWQAADKMDYVELPIELRVLDVNGAAEDQYLAKNVYLTDVTIAKATVASKLDITNALRVSFECGTNKVTYSKTGGEIDTYGKLDLNADGRIDKETGYEDFQALNDFVYGTEGSTETTTKAVAANFANDANPLNIEGTPLGVTPTNGTGLAVTVRIYLEGWQKLETTVKYITTTHANKTALDTAQDDSPFAVAGQFYKTADGKIYGYDGSEFTEAEDGKAMSSIWNDDEFVSAGFNVGMRFTADAHVAH